MASRRAILVPVSVILLILSPPVDCKNDVEEKLFGGINDYRSSLNLPPLSRNHKAACFADKVTDKLDDEPCSPHYDEPPASTFPEALDKCDIDIHSTRDAVVMQACVPHHRSGQVLANFTRSRHARHLRDSRFTGTGIGSEDDWIVVVLTTSTREGSFSSAASVAGSGSYRLVVFLAAAALCLLVPSALGD